MINRVKHILRKIYEKGGWHITLGTFFTKFVGFFGSVFVVRILNKTDYGMVAYVENIYSYAYLLAGLGMSNAMLRFLVISKDDAERHAYHQYIMKRSVAVNMAIVGAVLCINAFVQYPSEFSSAKRLLPILILLLPFQDIVNDELFAMRGFFKNKLYAYSSVIVTGALILGRVGGALFAGVDGVIWSRVILNALFAVIGLFMIHFLIFKDVKPSNLSYGKKKEIINYSVQYMVTNGLWVAFMLNDTLILSLLKGDPQILAEYKVAYVLPGNVSIFATAIGVFTAPYFTKHENNRKWIKDNFKTIFLITAFIVGAVVAFLFFAAKPLILLMYGNEYVNTVTLMRILLLAAFLNSGIRYTSANILAAMGKIKYNMAVSAIGMVILIILDFVLTPKFGYYGVAAANCFVYLIMGISLFIIFQRNYLHESEGGQKI